MSNSMDIPRLLAEVQKRPALWDFVPGDRRTRQCTTKLWQEIGEILGADAEQCRGKWKVFRDAYRNAVKRTEQRIERDKLLGVYDSKFNYKSKWVYFPLLSFLSKNKGNSTYTAKNNNNNLNSNDNNSSDKAPMENVYSHIKLEDTLDTYEEDDAENHTMLKEFQDIDATQPAERLLDRSLSKRSLKKFNVGENGAPTTSNDQVHISEDLDSKEDIEIKATERDIMRSIKSDRISDTDYNFLISFLPQMKKMSELQNAKFRAKVCDIVLNIFAENSHQPVTSP